MMIDCQTWTTKSLRWMRDTIAKIHDGLPTLEENSKCNCCIFPLIISKGIKTKYGK
jgi:hypothetical protein